MTALLDLLQKEKGVIKIIELLKSSVEHHKQRIILYAKEDFEYANVVIKESNEEIQRLQKEIYANELILRAVRYDILAYFTSIKEETYV